MLGVRGAFWQNLAELVDYSSETSHGEKGVLWSNWLGNLGLTVSCIPFLQVLFQPAQLLGIMSPEMGHASHLVDRGSLSPEPTQEVGSKSTLEKTDSNGSSPLLSACCVLGTVLSDLSVIAHVISPPCPQ